MSKLISIQIAKQLFADNKTVFMTGSFDFLHLGHVKAFAEVKHKLGADYKFIVAVLGDKEIKKRKGESRPVFSLAERLEMLEHIDLIDYLLAWEDDWTRLRDFVLDVKPDYLVAVEGDSGIENKRKHIEAAGGKLLLLKRNSTYSSSSIINKLKLD